MIAQTALNRKVLARDVRRPYPQSPNARTIHSLMFRINSSTHREVSGVVGWRFYFCLRCFGISAHTYILEKRHSFWSRVHGAIGCLKPTDGLIEQLDGCNSGCRRKYASLGGEPLPKRGTFFFFLMAGFSFFTRRNFSRFQPHFFFFNFDHLLTFTTFCGFARKLLLDLC